MCPLPAGPYFRYEPGPPSERVVDALGSDDLIALDPDLFSLIDTPRPMEEIREGVLALLGERELALYSRPATAGTLERIELPTNTQEHVPSLERDPGPLLPPRYPEVAQGRSPGSGLLPRPLSHPSGISGQGADLHV